MRKQHRSRRSLNRPTARLATSIASKQAAIWAIQMALSDFQGNFLVQDAERFINITAPHIRWTPAAFKQFFHYYDCVETERAPLEQLAPQEVWIRLIEDLDHDALQAFRAFRKFHHSTLRRVLEGSLKILEQDVAECRDPVMENVLMIQHIVGLSTVECKLLHLIVYAGLYSSVRSVMNGIELEDFADAAGILAVLIDEDEIEVASAMKPTGPLGQLGFLVLDTIQESLGVAIHLADWCTSCFREPHESAIEMMRHFIEDAAPTTLGIEDFPHLAPDLEALSQYLRGVREARAVGVNILIYGSPGTGKTEFTKVLATQVGACLFEVPNRFDDGAPILKGERLKYLRMAERFLAKRPNAVILFDEIEDVFPEPSQREWTTPSRRYAASGKAWMNRTLETNHVPVIWVSNHAEEIDPAYLRRFAYHLEIRTPPQRVRQRIVERYLYKTPVSSGFIQQLASDAGLTPALVENAANVVSLSGAQDTESAEQLVSRVIRQCQAVMGKGQTNGNRRMMTDYSLDYLNVDSRYSVDQIVGALRQRPRSSLCLYGLPGTGKTALAEHIANALGRSLIAKRASELQSKWLGDSEKNIAEMFREASAEQAVLLLDEADTFLRTRERAQRSWEVSQVNEFLQQMERFDGVFICATNLFDQIDSAALRRFAFKIAFKAMQPEQREKMFVREALSGLDQELTQQMRDRLHRMDSLVPGDFAVVKRQSHLTGVTPDPEQFLDELEAECGVKPSATSRAIGFLG